MFLQKLNEVKDEYIKELLELPEKLNVEEKKLLGLILKSSDRERSIKLWEITENDKIFGELDEDNKKKFSNEQMRKNELERRKDKSQEFWNLTKELNEARREEEELKIEIEYFKRRLRSLLVIGEIIK